MNEKEQKNGEVKQKAAEQAQASSPPPVGQSKDITRMAEEFMNKLPPIPENWKDVFVKWYPWLLIVFGALGLIGAIGAFSFASVAMLGPAFAGRQGLLWLFLGGVNSAISLAAGIQMRKMLKSGWKLGMIDVGLSIFITLGTGSGLGLIFSLVALYFLWQVKGRYH